MSCRRLMLLGMMISSARGFTQRSLALTRRTRTSPLNLSTRPARPTRLSARDKRAPGDRVFVSGIPKSVDWKDLKDHFRLCGEVAYASVSEGKDHGIVQYETVESAQAAVREMRDHPLHGATLHVREDIQDRDRRRRAGPSLPGYPSPGYPPRQPVTQPVAPPSSREEVDSDLRALTVPALKDLLRAKKLPLAGNTGELVARLLEWRETKENQSRPDDSGPNRPSSSMSARSMSARSSAWRRVDDDESETTPKALELIVGYCEDREKLRQEGDYEKADAIRSALQKKVRGPTLSLPLSARPVFLSRVNPVRGDRRVTLKNTTTQLYYWVPRPFTTTQLYYWYPVHLPQHSWFV